MRIKSIRRGPFISLFIGISLLSIGQAYVLQAFEVDNFVSIATGGYVLLTLILCIICSMRAADIHSRLWITAVIPFVGLSADFKILALLGLGGSTEFISTVAPVLAVLNIVYLTLLALTPGRS